MNGSCAPDVAVGDIAGAHALDIGQHGLFGQLAVILAAVDGREAGVDERAQSDQALQHLDDQVRAGFGHGVAQHSGRLPWLPGRQRRRIRPGAPASVPA